MASHPFLLILVSLILCCTASIAIPPSPPTFNDYTTSSTLAQQEESSTPLIDDVSAANHLPSSISSLPATAISASTFAFPSDWFNSEHDDSFHAARIAVEERKQQQHQHPAPNNNEDNNNEMSSSTTAKFPEVENNVAPEDPSSSTNTKVVGVIVGASVGGMVVVGAIALFVWQLHHRGGGDAGVLVNEPSFSPNTKSPDDEETKIDMNTMIQQQPPLSPVSEATSLSSSPSASLDEKGSLAKEEDDFGQSTLDAFDQIGTKYRDSDNVPCPDLISSVQSSSAPPPRAALLAPKDETTITSSSSPSLTDMPKKKMSTVKRACPVIIENNASPSSLELTHTRHTSTLSTSPTTLSYPLKKLLHYPRCHVPQIPPPVASPASTTAEVNPGDQQQQDHFNRSFTVSSEQQQQEQQTRMNPTGMVTPFDLPPTEFLPLQNCPFPLVSRQSVMIDPSKRQGIHKVPNEDEQQE